MKPVEFFSDIQYLTVDSIRRKYGQFLTDEEIKILKDVANRRAMQGKCPKDGRKNRPIYITMNNKRVLAVADGEGHAYKVYGEGYAVYESECKPENKYDPKDYEFERGLSGMDF